MVFTTAFFIGIILYLGLASVGHKCLFHQFYVTKLLQLFEYGNRRVEKVNERLQQNRERKRKLSRIREQGGEHNGKVPGAGDSDTSDTDSAYGEELEYDRVQINNNRHRSASLGLGDQKRELDLFAVADFARLGISAIVDDQVTKRFAATELQTWNLLTRTDKMYHYKSLRLALIWLSGTIFRYCIMFPIRFVITIIAITFLVCVTALIGLIPDGPIKRRIYYSVSIMCFRMCSRGFSGVITYHNTENKAKGGGICVANHTSPIDVVILHCDNSYTLVGQKHEGFLGVLQRALARAADHIWFERFEMSDRRVVSKRLREHSEDKKKLPILVFPEGTCINNSAVMMFKKGSFEVGATIYPVAIKYDARFGDPFWNSSKYGYMKYLLMMMTSWAIVCDVWYLPPMTREEGESAIDFAARVKAEIATKGGLVELDWDGQLKRQKVKPEWVKMQQFKFSQTVNVPPLKQQEDFIDTGIEENNGGSGGSGTPRLITRRSSSGALTSARHAGDVDQAPT